MYDRHSGGADSQVVRLSSGNFQTSFEKEPKHFMSPSKNKPNLSTSENSQTSFEKDKQ